jgi:hypothetical protein
MNVPRRHPSNIPVDADPSSPGWTGARQIEVPPAAQSSSTLPRIDYAYSFLVVTRQRRQRTAWQWARRVLEDAPPDTRHAMQLGWAALGLQLGPERSERHLLGWEVRRDRPDEVLLGAISSLGLEGELLFQRLPNALLYATLVQLNSSGAHALWARTEPAHREIVLQLLTRAASTADPEPRPFGGRGVHAESGKLIPGAK